MPKIELDVEEVWDLVDDAIEEKIIDHTRWSVYKHFVFKYNDKFYSVTREDPATECQDVQDRFRKNKKGLVECQEVTPVEVTTVVYALVKD